MGEAVVIALLIIYGGNYTAFLVVDGAVLVAAMWLMLSASYPVICPTQSVVADPYCGYLIRSPPTMLLPPRSQSQPPPTSSDFQYAGKFQYVCLLPRGGAICPGCCARAAQSL